MSILLRVTGTVEGFTGGVIFALLMGLGFEIGLVSGWVIVSNTPDSANSWEIYAVNSSTLG